MALPLMREKDYHYLKNRLELLNREAKLLKKPLLHILEEDDFFPCPIEPYDCNECVRLFPYNISEAKSKCHTARYKISSLLRRARKLLEHWEKANKIKEIKE